MRGFRPIVTMALCCASWVTWLVGAQDTSLLLAWDPSPDARVDGYVVYYGPASGYYTASADAGTNTQWRIDGLLEEATYFFVVKGYAWEGGESAPSNEVVYEVPASNSPVGRGDEMVVEQGGQATMLMKGAMSVLENDLDRGGLGLTAVLVKPPRFGRVALQADGTFRYQHNGGSSSRDSFTYVATDGILSSTETVVRVSVAQARFEARAIVEGLKVTLEAPVGSLWRIESSRTLGEGARWSTLWGPVPGTGEVAEADLESRDLRRLNWGSRRFLRSVVSTAAGELVGRPMGFKRLVLGPGANFFGVPFHPAPVCRAEVLAVNADTVTLAGAPLASGALGTRDGFPQHVLVAVGSPWKAGGAEGEWWPVVSNDARRCTVAARGGSLADGLRVGDQVEVRRLVSVADLFGTEGAAPGLTLNPDSNLALSSSEEDVIQLVDWDRPSTQIIWHDGSLSAPGYYCAQAGVLIGPLDGTSLCILPDEVVSLQRLKGGGTLMLAGEVQTTALAHYLVPGPNLVSSHFAVASPIETCGLGESGWVADDNLSPSPAEEDLLAPVTSGGLGSFLFYHGGALGELGWYSSSERREGCVLEPCLAYLFLIRPGTALLRWVEPPPF